MFVTSVNRAEGSAANGGLRAFLLAVNGGIPTPLEFDMAEPGRPGERICVDIFYGIGRAREQLNLQHEQLEIIERPD